MLLLALQEFVEVFDWLFIDILSVETPLLISFYGLYFQLLIKLMKGGNVHTSGECSHQTSTHESKVVTIHFKEHITSLLFFSLCF